MHKKDVWRVFFYMSVCVIYVCVCAYRGWERSVHWQTDYGAITYSAAEILLTPAVSEHNASAGLAGPSQTFSYILPY